MNKKLKILITCGQMSIGGVQKSLVELLKTVNYDECCVHLMLPNKDGDLIDQIPKEVIIIEAPSDLYNPTFSKKNIVFDLQYLKRNRKTTAGYLASIIFAFKGGSKQAKQNYWKHTKENVMAIYKYDVYDIAISYAGCVGIWNQFVIDIINAKLKLCWIHGNYSVFGTKTKTEKQYLCKFDRIVTVSKTSEVILTHEVPPLIGKTMVISNIINVAEIEKLSECEIVYKNDEFIRFVSVSRLDMDKGLDLAIKAFSEVIRDGFNVNWDIIGEGNEKNKLDKLIKSLKVSNRIRLLGKKINPYPYIKQADIFFHPSKGEGKSIAVDEAKRMRKPILITDYPTVKDQIENNVTGLIVPISEEGIYSGIVKLVQEPEFRSKLTDNLKLMDFSEENRGFEIITEIFSNEMQGKYAES